MTNDYLVRNEVLYYVLDSCITNRYHLIDMKTEQIPFSVKFDHCSCNNNDISFLKMPNHSFMGWGDSEFSN